MDILVQATDKILVLRHVAGAGPGWFRLIYLKVLLFQSGLTDLALVR